MKEKYHRQITLEALSPHLDGSVLKTIISANLGQDVLRYQFGHDHFHYDNNSFIAADSYVADLRQAVLAAMHKEHAIAARGFFGRLTHTVQDFYAHSNYVTLWRERFPYATEREIEPELPELLKNSRLCSGRLYYPLEVLAFVPALRHLVLPFLPHDSHAWMNLDSPDQPGFELAFAAAVKRTYAEYLRITKSLAEPQVALFVGNSSH